MDLQLNGKNALVCGGSSGIGKACAVELAQLGANVTLLARNSEKLSEALNDLQRGPGQDHDFLVADTADHDELRQKIKGLSTQKNIHILINNSGGPPGGEIVKAREEEFVKAFQQHLLAYHITVQLLLPGMQKDGYGRIINIISTSVKQPLHGLGVSNTIRAAVANWSKTMANELASSGITVNNVLPGATETERLQSILMNKAAKSGSSYESVLNDMLSEIPMGRIGKSEEIAAAVAFLASPAASYITGTQITVDGGRTGVL